MVAAIQVLTNKSPVSPPNPTAHDDTPPLPANLGRSKKEVAILLAAPL
jgi:hypothetical protein